jgi:hypothetical protein
MTGAPGNRASDRSPGAAPRARARVVAILAVIGLAGLSAMLGFACGSSPSAAMAPSLPAAGSPQDDGSGLLARASHAASLAGLLRGDASQGGAGDHASQYGGSRYGGSQYGGSLYGGSLYGGSLYGGNRYGGSGFDWSRYPWSSQPQPAHAHGYIGGPVTLGGTIEGRVLWSSPPRAAPALATEQPGCEGAVANDTLRVDARGRVHGAVVYLENIQRGRYGVMEPSLRLHRMQIGGVLRQERCRFFPHVQVVSPVGALIRLVSDDSTPRLWTGKWDHQAPAFQASISRLVPRQIALDGAGFMRVGDDQTPASAWLVVAGHPYYTITGEDGRFSLHDVPPGTYTVVVWHEPVARLGADGTIELTGPVMRKVRVRVRPEGKETMRVNLPAIR